MKHKITSLFRKVYNKLFRKKSHGTNWGQKFNGSSSYSDSYFSKSSTKNLKDN